MPPPPLDFACRVSFAALPSSLPSAGFRPSFRRCRCPRFAAACCPRLPPRVLPYAARFRRVTRRRHFRRCDVIADCAADLAAASFRRLRHAFTRRHATRRHAIAIAGFRFRRHYFTLPPSLTLPSPSLTHLPLLCRLAHFAAAIYAADIAFAMIRRCYARRRHICRRRFRLRRRLLC